MTRNEKDAAVSEVIGVVLMLGLAVLLIAILQVSAVPVWNEAIEVEHSQQVQDEITGVRSAVLSTAGSGGSGSASVSLGTGYPNRIVLRSPPDSTGRLATTPAENITVGNVTATVGRNAATYWESTDGNLSTRGFAYAPDYNEYQGAPTTVYENTVVYNRFSDGNGTVTGQAVVDGRRLNLVTLDGRLSRDSSSRISVETEPVSAPSNAVTVTNTSSGNLTVELPGALPVDRWRTLLEDEKVENGGHVVAVNETDRGVVVEMEGGVSYEMRAARVGVGDGVEETEGEYVVKKDGVGEVVPEGTTITLVGGVRDGYNNPVAGKTVNATVVSGGSFESGGSTAQETTGGSGEASFRYEVAAGSNEVRVSINGDTEPYENVTFEPQGTRSGSSGGGGGAYDAFWKTPDTTLDIENDGFVLNLTMGTNPVAQDAPVQYAVNNSTVGTLSTTSDRTNSDGENTTRVTARDNGTVKVYTWSGGGGDNVNVTVVNYPPRSIVYNNDAAAYDVDDGGGGTPAAVNFSITNEGVDVTLTDMWVNSPDATYLAEGSSNTPWDSEVRINVGGDSTRANEGTNYELGSGTRMSEYEDEDPFEVGLQSGETATVYMHKFRDGGENQVDMDGKEVNATFEFQDSDGTFTETYILTPRRPPTEFTSLTADGSFRGGSGNVQAVDFSGEVNNPDTDGEVVLRLLDGGTQYNSDSVDMSGSFGPVTLDAGNRNEPITVVADLIDGDDNTYQSCEGELDQASDPLSLSDFSCSFGSAQ